MDLFEFFRLKKIENKTPNIVFNGFSAYINSELDKKSLNNLLENSDKFKIVCFDYYYKENKNDLSILNEFFKIKKDKWFSASKLGMLSELKNLQNISLALHDEEDMKIFSELYMLENVVSLNLGHFFKKYDISRIVDFKETLESLAYENDARKGSEKTISELKNLKSISFSSAKFEDFSFLEDIKLQEFFMYGSRTTNFNGLQKIKTMRRFGLKLNPKIRDFDFILNFENLEELTLHYVKYHQFLPDLSTLKKLKIKEVF